MPDLKATLIDQRGNKRVVPGQGAKFETGERLMTPGVEAEVDRMKQSTRTITDPTTGQEQSFDFNSPEVIEFQQKYPGVSIDAALGSLRMPSSPATTAQPTTQPAADTTGGTANLGLDINNIDLSKILSGEMNIGTQQGEVPNPDVAGINQQISDIQGQMTSPGDVDAQLAQELAAIDARYDQQNFADQKAFENRTKVSLSDLASVQTNPLSSGGASITRANEKAMTEVIAKNNMLREQEKAAARARAAGVKTGALRDVLGNLQKQKQEIFDRSDKEFNQRQQLIQNSLTNLNTVIGLMDRQRNISLSDKTSARGDIQTLFDTLGSRAFQDADGETLRKLEKAAGLPFGSINLMRDSYSEQEQASQAQAARDAAIDEAKALKTFTDAYGNVSVFNPLTGEVGGIGQIGKGLKSLIAPSGGSGGGRGGSGKFTDTFEAWYFDTFGKIASPSDPDAQAEYERWRATGGSSGLKTRTAAAKEREQAAEEAKNPGGYTDQELRKLRKEGIDPTNIGASDDFLYTKKSTGSDDDFSQQLLNELRSGNFFQ